MLFFGPGGALGTQSSTGTQCQIVFAEVGGCYSDECSHEALALPTYCCALDRKWAHRAPNYLFQAQCSGHLSLGHFSRAVKDSNNQRNEACPFQTLIRPFFVPGPPALFGSPGPKEPFGPRIKIERTWI